MATLMKMLQPLQSEYVDRRFDGTKEEYFKQLELSSTLYIGNLSFYTTEDQIHELFNKVGVVQRVIMGLDRHNKTPCGFCFVIYHTRKDALAAVKYLNGTKLDNRQLRVDIDYGFEEGRQFGRGRSGGQVRDEFRTDYDADRGGYGRVVAQQVAAQQLSLWQEVQAGALLGAGVLPGAAGGAVFFDQAQREALGQRKTDAAAAGAAEEGAEGAEAAEEAGGVEAGANPRMRGRDREEEEEEDQGYQQQRVKRRRLMPDNASQVQQQGEQQQPGERQLQQEEPVGGAAAAAGAYGAGVGGDVEQQEEELLLDADEEAAEEQEGQDEGQQQQQEGMEDRQQEYDDDDDGDDMS